MSLEEYFDEYSDEDVKSLVPQTKEIVFNEVFEDLFVSEIGQKRYWNLYGGRGSGKSWVSACFSVMLAAGDLDNHVHRILYLRQVMSTSEDSTMADVEAAIVWLGKEGEFKKRGSSLTHRRTGGYIGFKGIRSSGSSSAKLKSLSGVTTVIFEEAEEIESFDEFSKIDESIRIKGKPLKIVLVYNPTSSIQSWIHDEWFVFGKPNPKRFHDTAFMHSTYLDNIENLDEGTIKRYKDLKITRPTYYKNTILAEWTLEMDGKIYDGWREWKFFDEPDENCLTWYGLDFSYGGSDFTSCVKVRYFDSIYYVEEVFSVQTQKIRDTVDMMLKKGVPKNAIIYADCAMPLLVTEIRDAGFRAIRNASKGNVESGIKKIQNKDIVLVGGTINTDNQLYDGYMTWARDDKGKLPHEPDALAAMRYAINSVTPYNKNQAKRLNRRRRKVKGKGFINPN